jgi:hypothetical protein
VLSVSTKQKIKPINVMGISRRFAFIPFPSLPFLRLYRFLPCHCAFLNKREGVTRVDFSCFGSFILTFFPLFLKEKAKQWIEIMVFADIFQPQNAENAFAISPSKWHYSE